MKSLMKKAALAAALTVALGAQVTAHATSLGTLGVGTLPFYTNTVNGSFDDLYTFQVVPNGGTVFASTAVTFSNYGASVTGLAVYLGGYTSASQLTGLTAITSAGSSVTQNLGGGLASTTVSAGTFALTPGNTYTLAISGSSIGSSAYTTVIALQAVPEPESYAMLAAGLGMMGFIARRRSRRNG